MKSVLISLLTALLFATASSFTCDAHARDKKGAILERDEYIGLTGYKKCFYKVVVNGYTFSIRHKGAVCPFRVEYNMESNTYCAPSPYNNYCSD